MGAIPASELAFVIAADEVVLAVRQRGRGYDGVRRSALGSRILYLGCEILIPLQISTLDHWLLLAVNRFALPLSSELRDTVKQKAQKG